MGIFSQIGMNMKKTYLKPPNKKITKHYLKTQQTFSGLFAPAKSSETNFTLSLSLLLFSQWLLGPNLTCNQGVRLKKTMGATKTQRISFSPTGFLQIRWFWKSRKETNKTKPMARINHIWSIISGTFQTHIQSTDISLPSLLFETSQQNHLARSARLKNSSAPLWTPNVEPTFAQTTTWW